MGEQAPRQHHEALQEGHHIERLEAHASPEVNHAEIARNVEQMAAKAEAIVETETSRAEQTAHVREQLQAASVQPDELNRPTVLSKAMQAVGATRTLNSVRRSLSPTQRVGSKVIHQPVIRAVSEAASGTVSRPSGIFGGSLLAFIGTSGYFYLAKHMGFEYNSGVFVVLFLGGFILGIAIELVAHLALGGRKRATQ